MFHILRSFLAERLVVLLGSKGNEIDAFADQQFLGLDEAGPDQPDQKRHHDKCDDHVDEHDHHQQQSHVGEELQFRQEVPGQDADQHDRRGKEDCLAGRRHCREDRLRHVLAELVFLVDPAQQIDAVVDADADADDADRKRVHIEANPHFGHHRAKKEIGQVDRDQQQDARDGRAVGNAAGDEDNGVEGPRITHWHRSTVSLIDCWSAIVPLPRRMRKSSNSVPTMASAARAWRKASSTVSCLLSLYQRGHRAVTLLEIGDVQEGLRTRTDHQGTGGSAHGRVVVIEWCPFRIAAAEEPVRFRQVVGEGQGCLWRTRLTLQHVLKPLHGESGFGLAHDTLEAVRRLRTRR